MNLRHGNHEVLDNTEGSGLSRLYNMLEICHSDPEPLICFEQNLLH